MTEGAAWFAVGRLRRDATGTYQLVDRRVALVADVDLARSVARYLNTTADAGELFGVYKDREDADDPPI